jgi:hypothetical protein
MISERELDFGVIPKGGRGETDFSLFNSTDHFIEVTSVTTSCDCLSVSLGSSCISPGQKIQGKARIDLRNDDFKGALRIEILGQSKDREVTAFRVHANLDVRDVN